MMLILLEFGFLIIFITFENSLSKKKKDLFGKNMSHMKLDKLCMEY